MSHHEDAQLILQIYDLRREARLREARNFMTGPFKAKDMDELNKVCPPGSDQNAYFRQVITYWDLVSAIAKRQIVDKELFFETNGELTTVWEKVRHLVPGMRKFYTSPLFLANFEKVALEREKYLEEKAPGYLEALRKRLA